MADESEDEEEPSVDLGSGASVAGIPLARVASRLTYGIEKSAIRRREGDTEIRTAAGPKRLGDLLDEIDDTYFDRRQAFERAVRAKLPDGAVPTE